MMDRPRPSLIGRLAATALLAVALPSPLVSQGSAQDLCAACHGALGDERLSRPVTAYEHDIHKAKGFGCVACHGGDATVPGLEAMDRAKGFVGKPAHRDVPRLCGRCHGNAAFMKRYNPSVRVDQLTEYATSVHGQRLADFNDQKVATCATCHVAHSIRPPSDPQSSVHPLRVARLCGSCHADAEAMRGYAIPTDQLAKYERSVHWRRLSEDGDLSAPTCNDCHGNHGAAPPGVSWVGNVCGQCHPVMADAFQGSVKAVLFESMGVPGCATCHGNHDIAGATNVLLGFGDQAVCSRCHEPGVGGGVAVAAMREAIDSLVRAVHVSDSLLSRAENSGMEVSQALFELDGARTALVHARAAVHFFDADSVRDAVAPGFAIATATRQRGEQALAELTFRRVGLAVSSVIIVLLIAGILLKIRQIEHAA